MQGAFQYNLAIATSVSVLPTSYTQMSCPACTMFVSKINGTSYTVPSGILQLGTTYYWEVQADSGTYFPGMSVKGGDWTLPYSLTTGSNATRIQSVSVNPSSLGSGSYTVVTVTLNGIAPSNGTTVTLTSSNGTALPLPPSIKALAGQNTASVSVLSGSVTTTTTLTVSASYGGTQTTTVTVVPDSGVLTTTAASGITGSAAALNGTVNPRGANGQYQFQWSTDPTLSTNLQTSCSRLGDNCPGWTANSTTQSFTFPVSGLPNSATYYFRLAGYDLDNGSLWNGAILSFTTQ